MSSPEAGPPLLALLADDLTGALDSGAGFARTGLRTVLPFSGDPRDAAGADVVLLSTETRDASAEEAYRAARAAAERVRQAGIKRVYKKIDSVLRGQPGPELAAVLDVFGGRAAVAPAFPAQGRTTCSGVQLVHGQPATAFGGDLRLALQPATPRCDLFDASSEEDLARIAAQAASSPAYRVWCGTAGLAAHLPAALHLPPRASALRRLLPRPTRVLVVAGSSHPATRAQLRLLLERGWPSFRLDPLGPPSKAAATLAEQLAGALQNRGCAVLSFVAGLAEAEVEQLQADPRITPATLIASLRHAAQAIPLQPGLGLVMTGGETAYQVCTALGATAIEVAGQVLPGLPTGRLVLPSGVFALATKSGGFGNAETLLTAAEALLRSDSAA
jgi:uncharacterized protein YgbK (DUF1537 family)